MNLRQGNQSKKSQAKKFAGLQAQASIKLERAIPLLLCTALTLILVLAGFLRLGKPGQSPPGLHVDEAANAWNAYCLLKTGTDQHGVRWPVFYTRAFGENRSALFLYTLLPFQAVWGLSITTTRLPGAIGGTIVVLLIYIVGTRFFGRATGLVAAAMLAANPWHLQMSRWGHESTLTPLLIMVPLAAFLWANAPFSDDKERSPRPVAAASAGAVAGICCYGYPAVRLFLPVFLLSAVLVTWRGWWDRLKTRSGVLAIGAILITGAATFGPLMWKHVTDAEINKRGQATWVWSQSDTPGEKIQKVLSRYPGHFGTDFLFIHGDRDIALSPPPGNGLFHWYMLPMMIVGLIVSILRFKSSRAARVLLTWLALYPVADLLNEHPSMHALRSLPGLCALILLAALGAVIAGKWLWGRHRLAAVAIACVMAIAVIVQNARFIGQFFGDFNRQPEKYSVYGVDILEACEWLRPRFSNVDAVFCTGSSIPHPAIYTLVGLRYDPKQWFRDVRNVVSGPLPGGAYKGEEIYSRYGKMYFLLGEFNRSVLEELSQNGRRDHVIFIVRPGELGLEKITRPTHQIRDPQGRAVLWIFDGYV
ncbi:MAG: glycosyltransferase family 39 protein [Acidobacteria bacterium]|nr:glycosyltransferase family 39 protein [Acidobacteriota bacterium]